MTMTRRFSTPRKESTVSGITVIVACQNSDAYIGRCMESIANQDHSDVEVVVADGGSTDGTVRILQRYAEKMGTRFSWVSEPDQGLADAWNKAVGRSTGDWLIFLGADDTLSAPNVMSRASARLSGAFPEYSVAYGSVAMTDPDGHVVEYFDPPWSPAKFRGCIENLPHAAVFHHRSLFARCGPFDRSFAITLDYDFLLRELTHSAPLHIEGLVVTNVQIGGVSTDYHHRPRAIAEHIRLSRHHIGRIQPIMYWWMVKAWGSWLLYQVGGARLVFSATNSYRRLVGGRPPLRH